MNEDVLGGQWNQVPGELKSWWDKLSENDLNGIAGQKDRLIGLVQEALDNGSQYLSVSRMGSLIGGLANDAKDLLLEEVALTKLEVQYELYKAKTVAITLGIGVGIVAVGGILLMHMLAEFTVVPLWGCYGIVGITVVVLCEILLARGKTKAEERDVMFRQRQWLVFGESLCQKSRG
jgi:uncharacterized protein YjbJ (UPF0337 family)